MSITLELRVTTWWVRHFGEYPLATDQEIRGIGGSDEKLVSATNTDTEQLRWWLLSLTQDVEVRKPTAPCQPIASAVKTMTQRYSQ